MEKILSIKDVSHLTGISPSNIRYYEMQGLIRNINRDVNGVRRFSEKDIEWIQFLARLKRMEMPITQMKKYADLRAQGDSTLKRRLEILIEHKKLLLQKMDRLLMDINLLDGKIEFYNKLEEINNE